jgi:hypothetical protein
MGHLFAGVYSCGLIRNHILIHAVEARKKVPSLDTMKSLVPRYLW